MKRWKLSCYTSVVAGENGDTLLYNSFMGAIARLPEGLERFTREGAGEEDLSDRGLKELCANGFFVPSDLAEQEMVAGILRREREAAFHLIILPHESCNFRCVYCYERHQRGRMGPDVIAGLKSLVERRAEGCRGLSVAWFGGEPLLARDVISDLSESFLASCRRRGLDYESNMTSNGYFLTPEVVDELLRCEVRRFQVTLDGPAEAHDMMRRSRDGQGTYRTILGNLAGMRDRSEEFSVRIRVNFGNHSLPLLSRWLSEELAPLFAGDHRFAVSFHAIGAWGGPNDAALDLCAPEAASTAWHLLTEESLTLGFPDSVVKERLRPHGYACYAGNESSLVVGADGTLYRCTIAFEDPRNQVGRLTPDGELDMDQGRWDLWARLAEESASECASCRFHPSCQGRRCPLKSLDDREGACPKLKDEYESLVRMVVSAGGWRRALRGEREVASAVLKVANEKGGEKA
jgi:uncharacterized protein